MLEQNLQTFLGPCPSKKMLLYWSSCIGICIISWNCYLFHPLAGVLFISLAPFVNLFLFFKSIHYTVRTFLYLKTYQKAKKNMLKPNWGHAQGGFILVDNKKQLWIANGILGKFAELTSITVAIKQQAYYIQLNRHTIKPLTIGMNSIKEAQQAAKDFQKFLTN